MHFHLPPELDPFESAMRGAVKGRVARGHLQIHVLVHTAPAWRPARYLNRPLMEAYLSAFRGGAAGVHAWTASPI